MAEEKPFRVGDFVRFHVWDGHATGIIENIRLANPQTAMITVRNGTFKPKKYYRPLYKLRHAL